MTVHHRWITTTLFAAAMGYLEAAVVYYLRILVDRIQPYLPNPLPEFGSLAPVEIAREAATMVMIFTVGSLAGRTWRGRIGFSLLIFGVWDITYYLFLRPLTGWPTSLADWDILFLIPLPWWGPIWAPMSIALLMILFGLLTTVFEQGDPPVWPDLKSTALCFLGIFLALYIFMADAIAAMPKGREAVHQVLPQTFATTSFFLSWVLMSAPIYHMAVQIYRRYRPV